MASMPTQPSRARSNHSSESAVPQPSQQSTSHASLNDNAENIENDGVFVLNNPRARVVAVPVTPRPQPERAASQAAEEARICWICQQDESEDTAETSAWRSPCPCSLRAHEECLLQWIAAEEELRPNDTLFSRVVCPQCKSDIHTSTKTEFLVTMMDVIKKTAQTAVYPTIVSSLVGTFYSGSLIYGINSFYLLFGDEEAIRLLSPSGRGMAALTSVRTRSSSLRLFKALDPFFPRADALSSWKMFIGLPMIAPVLILSRVKSPLVDDFFALIPATYLLFRAPENRGFEHWPPSPAAAITTLTYLRSAYNDIYRIAFSGLEKQWDRELHQFRPEVEPAVEAEAAQLGVQVVVEEAQIDGQEQNQAPIEHDQIPGPPPRGRGRERDWQVSVDDNVFNTIMGALFFPAVSSAMGELLKATLPSRWVIKQAARGGKRSGGLLQEQWGRTIVGGCLFVVLKDVINLYCKWRKAKSLRDRRVMDYVRKKKRTSQGAAQQ